MAAGMVNRRLRYNAGKGIKLGVKDWSMEED